MDSTSASAAPLVTLTIDGREVKAPKGMNLIEAARLAGVEVPFYCYHPHLSVAGNCRMCTVKVEGMPKLAIGCGTTVAEGMKVQTQVTSKEVADTQAATLEFILINHPLDCTVCDQAGHCKLQDYHYEYNARPSRFVEEKVHKVKAEPLGPTVSLDGERCIMCTRCVRFCDEVTGTSELGMLNRGDRSVIAVNPGRALDNPFSGTVVDLCPVGALTHRGWRFNSRIWFTKESEGICPGCSTGCNVKVAARDGEVVQVKARINAEVNKEWLCDEGRYGFMRFLPADRLRGVSTGVGFDEAATRMLAHTGALVFIAPDLLLEEYRILRDVLEKLLKPRRVTVQYRERTLSELERILISPDYAANVYGAQWIGLVSSIGESEYKSALAELRSGSAERVLCIGDRAIASDDLTAETLSALRKAQTIFVGTDRSSALAREAKVAIAGRSILEKSGLLVNRNQRLQYTQAAVEAGDSTIAEWKLFARMAQLAGLKLTDAVTDRDATMELLAREPRLLGLRIASIIRSKGVCLKSFMPGAVASSSLAEARSLG